MNFSFKDAKAKQPELLAIYVSEPVNNEFQAQVLGGKHHSDAEVIKLTVQQVAKTAFSRDIRLALIYDFAPRIEEFLGAHAFSID